MVAIWRESSFIADSPELRPESRPVRGNAYAQQTGSKVIP